MTSLMVTQDRANSLARFLGFVLVVSFEVPRDLGPFTAGPSASLHPVDLAARPPRPAARGGLIARGGLHISSSNIMGNKLKQPHDAHRTYARAQR